VAWSSYAILAFATVVALGLLTLAVRAGRLSGVDSYAAGHLMPFGTGFESGGSSLLARLTAYPGHSFHLGRVVRLPASALFSSLLIAVVSVTLGRRGRRLDATLWLLAFGAVIVAELLGKLVVAKPPVYGVVHGSPTALGFTHSFPSGHAARATLLAAAAALTWPKLWPLFAAWAAVVVVTAELDAIHTPSDLAGGLLIGALLTFGVLTVTHLHSLSVPEGSSPDRRSELRPAQPALNPLDATSRPIAGERSDHLSNVPKEWHTDVE
jgi:membrane-associated phospholipid phosphatase